MNTIHEQTTRHDPRTRPRTTTRDEDQHQPTKTPRTNQDTKERPGPDYITTIGPRQQQDQRTTTNHEDETTNHETSVPQSPRRYRERIFLFTVAKRPRSDSFFGQPCQFLSEQSVPKKRSLVRIHSPRSTIIVVVHAR